ncbi:hypothetical protein [Desulfobacter hydrogenophilus]|uniref:hypothetical protein n=1 Tax=Desulfobacter hydrogenophilus TaxID=2291 RepID=UPI0013D42C09|nr:hypothetical protein [Desulfobacter hydrogenophilus]NDY73479.1 hypothetical protein [Desulfobacter hydrogenophilus]
MPKTINIKICPCHGFVHNALMMTSATDNTMANLIVIVNTLVFGLVFFLLPWGFEFIILGTIRIHKIRRISIRISLMPVT